MSTGKILAAIAAVILAVVTLAVVGTPAGGIGGEVSIRQVAVKAEAQRGRPYSIIDTKFGPDPMCEKKREITNTPGRCKAKAVLFKTARYRPVGARLQAGNETWCAEWKMYMRGLYYINWKEEMRGSFCWIEGPAAPAIPRHDHRCGYGHAIGVDVEIKYCDQVRRYGDTTYGWWWSAYDQFRVTAVARGIPFGFTYEMHANQHPTGTLKMYPSSSADSDSGSWRTR